MTPEVLEYIFKGLISLGVGTMIYILKDFRTSLKEVSKGLTEVTITLKELIVKDNHKDEVISELKADYKALRSEVDRMKVKVEHLQSRNNKGD